jgi:GTPase
LYPASWSATRGFAFAQLDSKGNILNDGMFRNNSSAEYIARSAKVVTLVDLAGHEKYFKTTAFGLTGHLPDYACLIVGANAGQQPLPSAGLFVPVVMLWL